MGLSRVVGWGFGVHPTLHSSCVCVFWTFTPSRSRKRWSAGCFKFMPFQAGELGHSLDVQWHRHTDMEV